MLKNKFKEIISGKRWGMLVALLSILHFSFFLIIVILNRVLPFFLVHYELIDEPEGKVSLSQYLLVRILWDLEYYLTYPIEFFEPYFRDMSNLFGILLLSNSLIWGICLTFLIIVIRKFINNNH